MVMRPSGSSMTGFSGWVVCCSRRICCWAFAVPNSLLWAFFLSEQLGFNLLVDTSTSLCMFPLWHDTCFVLVLGFSFHSVESLNHYLAEAVGALHQAEAKAAALAVPVFSTALMPVLLSFIVFELLGNPCDWDGGMDYETSGHFQL